VKLLGSVVVGLALEFGVDGVQGKSLCRRRTRLLHKAIYLRLSNRARSLSTLTAVTVNKDTADKV